MKGAFLGLFLLAGVAGAEEPWLPLAEGKRWEYRLTARTTAAGIAEMSRQGRATASVEGKESVDGVEWFRVTWKDDAGGLNATHWVRSDAAQVEVARTSDDHLLLVPAKVEPGTTQPEASVRLGERTLAVREVKVGQPERVRSPWGEREAIPVESVTQGPATKITTRVWYARGVGPIRVSETVEAPAARIERELLLVSIDGKDATGAAPGTTPPVEREAPPAKEPAKAAAPAVPNPAPKALLERARALIAGDESQWAKLEEAAKAAHAAAVAVQPEIEAEARWSDAKERVKDQARGQKVSRQRLTAGRGFEATENITRSIVVVEGRLAVVGNIRDSLVIVIGDVELAGNLHDSLVLCTGTLEVAGNVSDAALAAGSLQALGNVHDCLVQYGKLELLGTFRENAVVGQAPGGKNIRKVDGPDLWGHFAE